MVSGLFRFAACDHARHFEQHGFVLVKNGVDLDFLDFIRGELRRCEQEQDDISPKFDKRGRKHQYLFNFPEDIGLIVELVTTLGELTGSMVDDLVVSERHLKVYPEDARPDPPPHKDRKSSQFAVGFPIVSPALSRLILYPYRERSENVFDSYDEFRRSLSEAQRPENSLKGVSPVVLDPQPGDLVVFKGSAIYHERMRAAGSKILYLKFNALGLDPIGENLPALPLKLFRDAHGFERRTTAAPAVESA